MASEAEWRASAALAVRALAQAPETKRPRSDADDTSDGNRDDTRGSAVGAPLSKTGSKEKERL